MFLSITSTCIVSLFIMHECLLHLEFALVLCMKNGCDFCHFLYGSPIRWKLSLNFSYCFKVTLLSHAKFSCTILNYSKFSSLFYWYNFFLLFLFVSEFLFLSHSWSKGDFLFLSQSWSKGLVAINSFLHMFGFWQTGLMQVLYYIVSLTLDKLFNISKLPSPPL